MDAPSFQIGTSSTTSLPDLKDMFLTRSMASVECHTDHRLDRCKLNILIKSKPKKGHFPQGLLFVIGLRSDLGRTTFQFDLQHKWNRHLKYTALQYGRESLDF